MFQEQDLPLYKIKTYYFYDEYLVLVKQKGNKTYRTSDW